MSAFKLSSTAFKHEHEIPKRFTCEGINVSPELSWSGVPSGTKSLALIVDDPDAPDPKAPLRIWVHWLLYNIPPEVNLLEENLFKLPEGIEVGLNDWKKLR